MKVVKLHTCEMSVDEEATIEDMRQAPTYFFKDRHGKRETYVVHRGCVIVRNTVDGARRTIAYLFGDLEGAKRFFCVGSNFDSTRDAKQRIDYILDFGKIGE